VVRSSSAKDSVLFEVSPERCCLAGIANGAATRSDGNEAGGEGGDAGESLEEIERCSLPRQKDARGAQQPGDDISAMDGAGFGVGK
jgi:hypothetical protein